MQSERSESFDILYTGDLKPEDIDIVDLIKILKSYNSLARQAILFLHGSKSNNRVSIESVRPGSIEIDGLINIIASLQPAFAALPGASIGFDDVAILVKSWLSILKFLKGKAPLSVNVSGESNIINGNIYNTLIMGDIGRRAQDLRVPMQRGASGLTLRKNKKDIAKFDRDDVEYFIPIRPVSDTLISEVPVRLSVISPVFEGESVWKFKYGEVKITAKVLDLDFLSRVHEGFESFRSGDRFEVLLRTEQKQIGSKIITSHYISSVTKRV